MEWEGADEEVLSLDKFDLIFARGIHFGIRWGLATVIASLVHNHHIVSPFRVRKHCQKNKNKNIKHCQEKRGVKKSSFNFFVAAFTLLFASYIYIYIKVFDTIFVFCLWTQSNKPIS